MTRRIFITGADGYLGSAVAKALLLDGDDELVLWTRGDAARLASLAARFDGFGPRLHFASGDLRDGAPFAAIDPDGITHIVHGAAVIRFNVDAALAQAVNVDGTRRLLEFARSCPRLEHVALVGSLYAAGLREGDIAEAPLAGDAGFANEYERSKHDAEALLVGDFASLPCSVLRLATVIADDASGAVAQFNAIHNSLRLMFHGLLSVFPGDARVPVYAISRDWAAMAIARLLREQPPGAVYHLSPAPEAALGLGRLLELAHEAFLEDPGYRNARTPPPLLCDPSAFRALEEGVRQFGGPVLTEAMASISPFAAQLFSPKRFDNARLVACLGAGPEPDLATLATRAFRHLVATRWGRK